MEARRELLVLSAQVQAALGEASPRPDSTGLLNRGRDTDDGEKPEFAEAIFAHEEAVKGMLDDARSDMDALVEDARTVPFQALGESAKLPPPPELSSVFSDETFLAAPLPPSTQSPPHRSAPSHTTSMSSTSHTPSMSSTSSLSSTSSMSTTASRMLLSPPFPGDAVPVPTGRRARVVVGLFGVAGIAVLVGTIWWLRSDKVPATSEAAVRTAPLASAPSTPSAASTTPSPVSTTPASAPDAPPAAALANTSTKPSALSLLVEARRSSWLRTTVDGESDSGRMLAQGETVRLNAKQSVSLRVGDAGAVFVSVNNGKAAPLGSDGQVVTRQFVAESTERRAADAAAQTAPAQKPAPLSSSTAAAPANVPTPSAPPPSAPPVTLNSVPLVQPVAATPSRQPVAATPNPPLEPGPPPLARAEATVPPTGAPRPELPTPGPAASPASAVVTASRQWLDAYHRQDRATMASLQTEGLQLTDERRNEERFPSNVNVSRTLDRVSVQIAADTAVLTAVMTERSSDNVVPPRVSPVSQVLQLRGNQWRVSQVRLVSEARLNQIFR